MCNNSVEGYGVFKISDAVSGCGDTDVYRTSLLAVTTVLEPRSPDLFAGSVNQLRVRK